MRCGFAYTSPYILGRGRPSPRGGYPPASPHRLPSTGSGRALHRPQSEDRSCFRRLASPGLVWTILCRYGNINPLSIDYACRPRLRSRLTLGGQTWPRNPWSFGGRDSHSAFATHACILTPTPSTPGSLRGFTGRRTLPYPTPPKGSLPRLRRCA